MVQDWLKQGPEHYAAIQRQIVLDAADMLAPGGMMLYSTCTFSQLEDEGTVAWLLEQRPEMSVVPVRRHQGFAESGAKSFRKFFAGHSDAYASVLGEQARTDACAFVIYYCYRVDGCVDKLICHFRDFFYRPFESGNRVD